VVTLIKYQLSKPTTYVQFRNTFDVDLTTVTMLQYKTMIPLGRQTNLLSSLKVLLKFATNFSVCVDVFYEFIVESGFVPAAGKQLPGSCFIEREIPKSYSTRRSH